MYSDAFEDLLKGRCGPAVVRAIEAGGDVQVLWDAIVQSGFLDLMAPEQAGGAAADLADALPLFTALGAYAVPLPVGQAIALRTLLPAGAAVPDGLPSFAPALRVGPDGALRAPRVPYGMLAGPVLGELDGALCLLDARAARRRDCGLHGEPTADLSWDAGVRQDAVRRLDDAGGAPGRLAAWGAALHAALLTGAMTRCFEMSVQYGNDRTQFGRSIGKFQAVQHQLAVMAEHVAAARIATAAAFRAGLAQPALLPAAIAKARASEAAALAANTAHAVHGAIGVTEEYDLQLYTRRLHGWRLAHGSEAYWHQVIGAALMGSEEGAVQFVRAL
ncbi:acyl-CoA dehydrogenase family protein [Bordetella bronchiseptica]|uniref:Acyl-CoA dehydrogenase n=1 Tax=Bordetella genomosp. 6 TaxID=463024 RepID=A0ABX4FD25_9BORD|nr:MULTISPECIES: acyl-CoA dehydrogenase family protein [Bordetella]KCV66251.1 acyl-CoA dehydrogenase, C-terminal domain protein [Bordetella bronchiseptica 99-R-0433]MBN3270093.1 acyl-CoA dehydrogenase [Bordetella bronchiseptica]OZI78719.1 acyl-CoA dehydrogenase [Bordetella genomosp. 6]